MLCAAGAAAESRNTGGTHKRRDQTSLAKAWGLKKRWNGLGWETTGEDQVMDGHNLTAILIIDRQGKCLRDVKIRQPCFIG